MTASNTLQQPIVEDSAAATAAVIQLQALRHQYGDRVALAGVSFDVRPAEIFGLLGPNGSGKTTTFRILSTLMLPSGGRALIMGHDVAREPALVRRNIGVVFQAQSIDIKLSAEENLMLIGHIYGLRGAALEEARQRNAEPRWSGRSRQGKSRDIFRRHAAAAGTGQGTAASSVGAAAGRADDGTRSRRAPRSCGSICRFCATKSA